jgi:putative ABC transport system permease protein
MGNGMPRILIIMLGSLAAIVMIMACFNYTNLMIAKSLSRAREIGVRKVIGAQRWQVFLQFIGEAVVFSVLALGISYLLLQMLKPAFMQLQITQEFSIDLGEDTLLLFYFILFSIGVGAIAGILPAGYLSAFKPAKVLKDGGSQKIYTRVTLRRALMVMQFTLSLIFIIVVTIIYRQIDYMYTKDYGINDQNILNVRLQGVDFQKLANEVRALPGVVSVGAVSHALGTWADRSSDYNALPGDEPFVMRDFLVDDNYLENIGVKFVAGRNFDPVADDGFEKSVILNEKALKQFSFPDPVSAIGEGIYVEDSTMLKVIGVVRDFHFRPLSYEIGPVAFRYKPESASFLSMQILPGQKESIVAALAPIWKKLDPVHTLEWKMMSEEIDQAYTDAGFTDILKVVGYIAFLALTLACLGMLGMAMYAARTRVKEIGVRKVMGANVADITLLLSRSFMVLIGIAVVIAVPVSVFLGDAFLNTYAYKISITPWLILFGAFVVISLGLVTIASQTVRAALSNPVDALHYE